MSKKNTIVLNHKNNFLKFKRILDLFLDFKKKIIKLKSNNYVVGVSGGADSLALSAMCKMIELNDKSKNFYYVHVNHGIRKNSLKEAKFAKSILSKQNISLNIINNKTKITKNVQHNARKIRYSLLSQECNKKKNIKYILTAHHKDDQIETFLIRLSRGSGVKGLSSMNSLTPLDKKVKVYRPFLTTNKKDLVFVAKKIFGKYVKDPSNKNNKYLRTGIRKLLPLLKKHGINEDQIIKSINNLKSSNETIDFYLNDVTKKILKKRNGNFLVKEKGLFSLNKELQLRVLGFAIKSVSKSYYPPRSKKILTALKFFDLSQGKKYQLGGCSLISRNNYIYISKIK